MIYEIRVYTLKPGCVGEYEGRFAESFEVRSKYSPMYGMWHTEIGPLNQMVHIWAYDSLQQRADVRAAALEDSSGKWPPRTTDLVVSQESDIINPIRACRSWAASTNCACTRTPLARLQRSPKHSRARMRVGTPRIRLAASGPATLAISIGCTSCFHSGTGTTAKRSAASSDRSSCGHRTRTHTP